MNDLEQYYDNNQIIEQKVVGFETPAEPDSGSSSDLIKGVLRHWPTVLVTFVLICAIGIPAIWFLVEPLYTVTGAIRVEPILENILTGGADKGGISNYQNFMNTQAIRMTSNQIVQGVADNLIDKNLSFFKDGPTNPINKLIQKIMNTRINSDPAVILKQAITGGVITVAPADRSELITITMKSQKPEDARRIVDAFISAYMDVEGRGSIQEQKHTLDLLVDERNILDKKLLAHRAGISKLAQPYGTTTPADPNDLILQRQRIPWLYAELARLESSIINLKIQVPLLKDFPEQSIEPEEMLRIRNEYISSNPAVKGLTLTIIQLERDLIMAQQSFSVENPVLKQKQELIDTFQLRLKEEREEAAKEFDVMASKEAINAGKIKLLAAQTELKRTEEHREGLVQELADEGIEMINVGNAQLQIEDLQLQFDRDKEMYDKVTRRIQELGMQRKRPARIYVFSEADIGPILDKRIKYITALIFGSLACGMMLAFLINKWDLRLQTPDDVSKLIGLRIIGTTTSSRHIKPSFLPELIAGDYQTIRINLGLINEEGIPRKLVVTSPGMREGKTTFSVNLATSMSRSGKKVLLIDGDLRKPDVADVLGIPEGSRCGLQDVLLGEEFDKAVYTIPSTGLDVLIADSQSRTNGYELLASPGTRQCIDMLSQHYDQVIIDTTPILTFPDALIWATLGDAVIIISYAGHTTLPDLKEANERLRRINVKVLGTVLSNVQSEHSYYRYDYKYYAQNAKSRGIVRRAKRKSLLPTRIIEDNPGNSTTLE